MVTTKLEMEFLDDQNKSHRISIGEPRADITDMEVFAAMDTLLAAGVFQSRNGNFETRIGIQIFRLVWIKLNIFIA